MGQNQSIFNGKFQPQGKVGRGKGGIGWPGLSGHVKRMANTGGNERKQCQLVWVMYAAVSGVVWGTSQTQTHWLATSAARVVTQAQLPR